MKAAAHSEPGLRFDVEKVRADFPILGQIVHGKRLIYLDSAATSQKPRSVIETLTRYYSEINANIHRGVHVLSERATDEYEAARVKVQKFLNARESREIIFCRGATEAINIVAHSYGGKFLQKGDEIIVSILEHHSNIVPWQMVCEATGAVLKVIPMNDAGELLLQDYQRLFSPHTKLVALTHVSNALGTINPVKQMIVTAHHYEVPVLIDGAQAVPHMRVDVQDLDCDFYVFSGHKVYGPTGIGVLYGKEKYLEQMPPYQGGGDMISMVTFEKTLYNKLPYKFEAGTPHIAGVIGLGVAIDYLHLLDFEAVTQYEQELLEYATNNLQHVPGLTLVGTAQEKAGVISFVLDHVHPHDIGTVLDLEGIAIRTGHHCAMPVMQRLDLPATARASLAFYNTTDDIDQLVAGLKKVREVFHSCPI